MHMYFNLVNKVEKEKKFCFNYLMVFLHSKSMVYILSGGVLTCIISAPEEVDIF